MTTRAPSRTNARATARPIPLVEPVTSACFPVSLTALDYTGRANPGAIAVSPMKTNTPCTVHGVSGHSARAGYDVRPGGGGGGAPAGGGGTFGGIAAGGGGGGGAEPDGGVTAGGGGGGGVDLMLFEYGTEPRDTGIWLPLAYMHCMYATS